MLKTCSLSCVMTFSPVPTESESVNDTSSLVEGVEGGVSVLSVQFSSPGKDTPRIILLTIEMSCTICLAVRRETLR